MVTAVTAPDAVAASQPSLVGRLTYGFGSQHVLELLPKAIHEDPASGRAYGNHPSNVHHCGCP
jgi:hypothetical protein